MAEKKESLAVPCIGSIAIGMLAPPPLNVGLIAAGILGLSVDLVDLFESESKKLFKEIELCNKSKIYPIQLDKKPTAYGFNVRYSVPLGLSLKQFEDKKNEIERYFKHPIQLEYDNGKNVLVRVYEKTLKSLYEYQLIDTKKLMEIPIAYSYGDQLIVIDIESAPHIMIAGTTGVGKSVLIRGILTFLNLKRTPEELQLYLTDLKKTELAKFAKLPMVKEYAIEKPQAEKLLNRLCEEMENRYTTFEKKGCVDITEYNKKVKVKMNKILYVADEFADLSDEKKCMKMIDRLARQGRAAGIHMILCTQRDDSNVITGNIKQNIPLIIGLQCANQASSKVVLDRVGLENLTGNGHFIMRHGANETEGRVMFLDSEDCDKLLKDLKPKERSNNKAVFQQVQEITDDFWE